MFRNSLYCFIVDLEQVNRCRVIYYFTEADKINCSLHLSFKHYLTYLYHLKSIFYPVNLILYYVTLLFKLMEQIHVFNSFLNRQHTKDICSVTQYNCQLKKLIEAIKIWVY